MNKVRTYLCGFGLLGGLFLIGSLMQSRDSQAKGAYSSPVTVLNTSAAPAVTSAIDDPGRIAYQSQQDLNPQNSPTFLVFTFGVVPANHRLVVQHVSGAFTVTQNSPAAFVGLSGPPNGVSPSNFFSPNLGGAIAFDQPVLVYFDAGQQPSVFVNAPTFTVNSGPYVSLTGYMLDCSAAPCAAIAH